MGTRGQAASDYLVSIAVILAIIVGVVLPLFGEAEVTLALAAARSGATSFAAGNSSLVVSSVDFVITGTNMTIRPTVYLSGSRHYGDAGLRSGMVSSIAQVFNPGGANTTATCVRGVYNNYCVDVG